MPRKPRFERKESERFQVSFHESLPSEARFLNAWFDQPWGRRQSWARNILRLGLHADGAGIKRPRDLEGSGTRGIQQKAHAVSLTLKRSSPADSTSLAQLDRLPYSRRSEWLRRILLLGVWTEERIPQVLSASTNIHPVAEPPTASMTVGLDVAEIPDTTAESWTIGPERATRAKPIKTNTGQSLQGSGKAEKNTRKHSVSDESLRQLVENSSVPDTKPIDVQSNSDMSPAVQMELDIDLSKPLISQDGDDRMPKNDSMEDGSEDEAVDVFGGRYPKLPGLSGLFR